MYFKEDTRYLSLEILFKLQSGINDALVPLAGPFAQQFNDLEGPLQTFSHLHLLHK